MSIRNKFTLGEPYSRYTLSELEDENNLKTSREGLYYCKKSPSTVLFVDLIKANKPERFLFNDYFENDYFHWDSQTTQHIDSPKIQEIVLKKVEIFLFVRVYPKIKSQTQPFIYCGRLEYLNHDEKTSKPVHILFESIDYSDNIENDSIFEIYNWKPGKTGRKTSNKLSMDGKISSRRKANHRKPN